MDPHDQTLRDHVRPSDWPNPEAPKGRYNLVVIGGGTAGLVSAAGAAGLGARVALVEKGFLGGDCLNFGCVPSKAVLRAAHAVAEVRRAGEFGVRLPGAQLEEAEVDFAAAMTRMRRLRAGISHHDSAARFRELGVDVYLGAGCFTGPDQVEVGGQTLRFERAVIATGGRATGLPIPGLAELGFLTNESIFDLRERPRRLIIIGAGPIGCELAQSFRRFGSEVAIVSLDPRLLPREDPDAAALLRERFEAEGIALHLGAEVLGAERGAHEGEKVLRFDAGAGEATVAGDEILVAVGRAPNVDGLGLEAAGVAFSRKGVDVDEGLRTANRRIYAAGDVASRYQFTHAADAMARMVLRNAFFFGRGKIFQLVIPWATYTEPEIAHVGLYAPEAEAQGHRVQSFRIDLAGVDRAILDGETEGFAKVHAGSKGQILGVTIVARHAGEMIGEAALAITAGLKLSALSSTIHPYPTQAEILKRAGDAYMRSKLTPSAQRFMTRYFAWRRGGGG